MKKESTTVHKIANYLRQEITFSKLKSGQHIKESEIAKTFKVSRVPVREAFRLLQSEGYIDVFPNRGSFVKKISRDSVFQTSKVYRLLVPVVLEAAIPRYNEKTYKKAELILKKIENCREFSEIGYLVWDFAKVIYGPSKMNFILSILEEIYEHSIRLLNELFENEEEKLFKVTAHKNFIKLCKKNKKDEAIKYWCEFVDQLILIVLSTKAK